MKKLASLELEGASQASIKREVIETGRVGEEPPEHDPWWPPEGWVESEVDRDGRLNSSRFA